MRGVTVRARLAEQQRLLDAVEWPSWGRHGIPAVAVMIGAVAVWEHTTHAPHSADPPDSTVPAALLIALSVVPWVYDWVRFMVWPDRRAGGQHLAFAVAVVVPLAIVHVGGPWLGIADASATAPQVSLMILLVVGCLVASCASLPVVLGVEAALLAVIAGRAAQTDALGTWTIWLIAAVVVGCGGLAMRASFVAMQRLSELQDELARRAVADERRRVAREVHDTVAHTLSVTMLHLTAARLAVERAPDRAQAALIEAERQGRAGMSDLRRIVHLLRAADDQDPDGQAPGARGLPGSPPVATAPPPPPPTAPAAATSSTTPGASWPPPPVAIERALPTIAELPALIERYAAAGLAITFEGDGLDRWGTDGPEVETADGDVPPAVGLAIYRVVQESLTNAARHGCGDARVSVVVDAGEAVLTVRNRCRAPDARDQAGGMGLVGMRERVVGLGGRFSAGPVIGNGNGNGTATATATVRRLRQTPGWWRRTSPSDRWRDPGPARRRPAACSRRHARHPRAGRGPGRRR